RNPTTTKLNVRLDQTKRSFTVPFGGSGDYVLNIKYVVPAIEGQGYEGIIPNLTWKYSLDASEISTRLSIPTNLVLNMVKSMVVQSEANQAELIPAPTGYGFLSSFSFNLPDRITNLEVMNNAQPFALEYTESSI
ncbi:hypothetical protein, partial [Staphylococcus aureus]|uniref:hypothetical protein n=1 Tax=Staphylococcus aureus TaxID=1280 RepID=UPI0018A79906